MGKLTKINKKFVRSLGSLASPEGIESALTEYFLKKNGIKSTKNEFINKLTKSKHGEKLANFFAASGLGGTLEELEKIFELLIPEDDKQVNGAVHTHPFIVDYIVENVIDKVGTVCDLSCGSGAFLLGAVKRLQTLSGKSLVELLERFLFGQDILEYSVRRAKILLTLFAIKNGEDPVSINFNLFVGDSLKKSSRDAFSEIFEKSGGFDYVVGNPPYVRIQDLPSKLREQLPDRWETIGTGNYNLYFAFFEQGLNFLKKDGKLGYITPNNYFTSLAGIKLRKYFSKKRQITKILNFNHLKLFENAQTYTCITFMHKGISNDFFEYCYLEDKKSLSRLADLVFGKCYYNWLDDTKWRVMAEEDFNNIKIIEATGKPLGKVCQIKVGIATLKDKIFFVKAFNKQFCKATKNGEEFLIERDVTRKVVKISSISDEKEIPSDTRKIIFPYVKQNGKYRILTEKELSTKYPKCYSYLLTARTELEKRDKGKKSYPFWFAWGRTQGMDFKGKRLYTRTFSNRPNFMLDEEEDALFCNGYAVFCENHIKAVQKILNSKIMEYYVKRTSVEIEGNFQCYQKNFIERFGIPHFTEEEFKYIEVETDKRRLDRWLIKRYGLSLTF